jgi:hypothetical protein
MADVEQKLYNALSNNGTLTALVGDRIFPVVIPEKTAYPCISYQTISNRDITDMSYSEPTLNFKRIQINIYDDEYGKVKNLRDIVKTEIYANVGRVESERDNEDDKLKIFGVSLDIIANNK